MYEIYVDGVSLYYPGDKINTVTEAKIMEELNVAGYMNITVPPTNPLYGSAQERKTTVEVRKDNVPIWGGEVREITQNMQKMEKLYIVGDLSYTQDSVQSPKKIKGTPVQVLGVLINEHNSQVEEKKRFAVGVVTIDVPGDELSITTNYEDTLSVIRSKICENNNGYIRIRRVNEVRYLDIVKIEDYGKTCEQPIQFGRNLLDYSNMTSGDVVTAIVPLGEPLEESEEGIESYVTISSVNGGVDYIYNQDAVDSFGWVRRKVHFEGITDPHELLTAGTDWLSNNQYSKLTIEVKAVDLSAVNSQMDSFALGDYVNAKAKPFGLNAWYYIRKKESNLLDKAQNTITIGNTVSKTFTEQTRESVGKVEKEIPNATKLLDAAKQNATNLIQSATNGNIFLVNDEQGNPKEMLIMDTKDIETAKKLWRWNINGLGYSGEGYDGTFGLAMTMDGAIVADFITAGTLNADLIKAGAIKVEDEDGEILFLADYDTNQVKINADNVFIGSEKVSDTVTSLSSSVKLNSDNITAEVKRAQGQETELAAAISIATNQINLKVSKGEVSSQLSVESGAITIKSNRFSWESTYSSLSSDGKLKCSSAEITGGSINIKTDSQGDSAIKLTYGSYFLQLLATGLKTSSPYGGVEILGPYLYTDNINATSTTGEITIGNNVHFSYNTEFAIGKTHVFKGTLQADGATNLNGTVKMSGNTVVGGVGDMVGFFGNNGGIKKTVANITTPSSATASTIATKLNDLLTALRAYNLIG